MEVLRQTRDPRLQPGALAEEGQQALQSAGRDVAEAASVEVQQDRDRRTGPGDGGLSPTGSVWRHLELGNAITTLRDAALRTERISPDDVRAAVRANGYASLEDVEGGAWRNQGF